MWFDKKGGRIAWGVGSGEGSGAFLGGTGRAWGGVRVEVIKTGYFSKPGGFRPGHTQGESEVAPPPGIPGDS